MISKKMKYALKALIEITNQKEKCVTAHDIAEKANIPLKFLEHILTELRKGRIINSKKGSAGGYYLLKDPQTITLADIYRLIEGPIALLPCASLHFYERCSDCFNENICSIHHALLEVRDETLRVLEKWTIESLANNSDLKNKNQWLY
jgi:Rrf2 family protein